MKSASTPRLDKRRRTYVRLIGEIHHALNQALVEEKAKRGLTKTTIGNILGLGRSAISKKFDGRHNFTLETLADLAYALDRSVKLTLTERPAINAGSNAEPAYVVVQAEQPQIASMSTALAADASRSQDEAAISLTEQLFAPQGQKAQGTAAGVARARNIPSVFGNMGLNQ